MGQSGGRQGSMHGVFWKRYRILADKYLNTDSPILGSFSKVLRTDYEPRFFWLRIEVLFLDLIILQKNHC